MPRLAARSASSSASRCAPEARPAGRAPWRLRTRRFTGGPAASDYRVSVLCATAYPAQMMSASERVTQQVYLYKWTGTRWSDAIASRAATRTAFPAAMPTATLSYLTQGHHNVVTRLTWQVYTSAGWTTTGTKVVDYNQASDYRGSYAAVAQAGYCTL